MGSTAADRPLNQITTAWGDIALAHREPADEATEARRRVLERYAVPAFKYLRKASGGEEAAHDLFQELSLRFVRGDFRGADPAKGRFRDYLKTALIRLVIERRRRDGGWPGPLEDPAGVPDPAGPGAVDDAEFAARCRAAALARAEEDLAEEGRRGGRPLAAALRLRVERPKEPSRSLARALAGATGRPTTANGFDKLVSAARARLADLLLDGVAATLAEPTRDALESELIDLGLHAHCRAALRRRGSGPAG